MMKGRVLALVVLAVALVGSACGSSDSEGVADVPTTTSSTTSTTTSTTTTTTTTLPPSLETWDLPKAQSPEADGESIRVLQRILDATCCSTSVDGAWGPRTNQATIELRQSFGLAEGGGLDDDLWMALLERVDPGTSDCSSPCFEQVDTAYGRLPLPASSIELPASGGATARYVIAAQTDSEEVWDWYRSYEGNNSVANWDWCRGVEINDHVAEASWWKRTSSDLGDVLTITLTDVGAGRVDLAIYRGEDDVSACRGWTAPTTTTRPPPTTTATPSSSGSGSAGGCSIGMNLEDCEDALGLWAGERINTIDCTGRNRSVWWASNWWIVGSQGGIPVISKDRYGCS